MKKKEQTTKLFIMALLGLLVLCGRAPAEWTVPVPVMEINTDSASEWTPFLSFDGLSLYFARGRTSGYYHFRIFEATRQEPYGPFTSVNEVLSTSGKHLMSPWVSPNNRRMYYFAQTEHPILWQLKVSERASVNDPWPQGTDISELNTLGRISDPRLTSDELIIFFRSPTIPGGLGGYDLWMATRPDRASPFDNVRNLAEINTAAHDVCPYVSPDGLTLVFQSGTYGDWQFFRSTRQSLSEPFGNIEQMPILEVPGYTNNHPSLSSDGSELYFIRLLGNDYSSGDIWISFLEGNKIYYVDADADGANDGSSWDDAYNYLQNALAVAENGDEIHVAQGVYKPAGYVTPPPPPPPPPPGGEPGSASNPYPADGAANVGINADLSWTPGSRVTSHDVYFGTSSLPPFISNQISATFDPGTMDESARYYWRIDELNNYGTNTGEIWSFTTTGVVPPPPPPPPPGLGESMEQATATDVSREDTFQLKNGVVIKGGYAGFGEPNPNARDIKLYETILSGDLMGNDVGGFNNFSKAENSYHVVTGSGCEESTVLDGFTITAGNDDRRRDYYPIGHGSGMLNDSGSPTVSNCTFTGNYASDTGGGMFNGESNPTLTNCMFIGNSAGGWAGGGMFNWESSPAVTNCTFISNSSKEWGGAICNYNASSPTLTNCIFRNNSIITWGGAICNVEASSPILSNCIFSGNSARNGGGMCNHKECSPTLTNCIFTENSAVGEYGDGGGMYNNKSGPTLTNCTFAGNKADKNGGAMASYGYAIQTLTNCILWNGGDEIYNIGGSTTMITYSDVQGGWPGAGNIDVDPCFVETEYFGPVSYWKFDETVGTTAYDSAGQNHGIVYGAQWTSGQVGSALDFDGMNDYVDMADTVKNYLETSYTVSAWIKTNTISANYPFSIIAYRHSTEGNPILFALGQDHADIHFAVRDNYHNLAQPVYTNALTTNTWHHIAGVREENVLNVYVNGVSGIPDSAAFGEISPDNLKIGTIMFGGNPHTNYFNGTIDDVIIFDRALSDEEIQQHYQNGLSGQAYPDVNTPDYHLLPDSPCINTGDPDYIAEPNETDLDGKPRVIGGRIDMGAYEFNHIPVADAGQDRAVEAQAPWGATVTLDGSGSSDADSTPGTSDDINAFNWYEIDPCDPNADVFLGSGRIIDCNLPFGEHFILLEVIDKSGAFDSKEVTITVQDTTPPQFELSVAPAMLWPPDHKMYEITPSWTVSDECDATPDVMLVSIAMNEADDIPGDGNTSDDIQIGKDGSIYLRSERSGISGERIYTITYQAVDDYGNTTVRSAIVSIPHDFKVLARIAAQWLWTGPGRIPEDLNGDGIVNLVDFARFAENWIR